MKKLISITLLICFFIACKKTPTNYTSLSGKIFNTNDTILIVKNATFEKRIKINNDGTFNDTLKVTNKGLYDLILANKNWGYIYLDNGFDIELTSDKNEFTQNTTFKGIGAQNSNFVHNIFNYQSTKIGNPQDIFQLEKAVFDTKIAEIKTGFDSLYKNYNNIDSNLFDEQKKQNDRIIGYLEKNYTLFIEKNIEKQLLIGDASKRKNAPKFNNFKNYLGGVTSLDDFKGKYVYIDVWATWCMPCLAEIPSLKKVEKQYHHKNIEFISISIDSDRTSGTWEKAEEKWKSFVKNKELSGIQLFASQDNSFQIVYNIRSIPRFILIDPNGKIIDDDAPRPSDKKLIELFDALNI